MKLPQGDPTLMEVVAVGGRERVGQRIFFILLMLHNLMMVVHLRLDVVRSNLIRKGLQAHSFETTKY